MNKLPQIRNFNTECEKKITEVLEVLLAAVVFEAPSNSQESGQLPAPVHLQETKLKSVF